MSENWKSRVEYDFANLPPEEINPDLVLDDPSDYEKVQLGYKVGRRDGVTEVLRDLRRFASYNNPPFSKEDIFNFLDKWYADVE